MGVFGATLRGLNEDLWDRNFILLVLMVLGTVTHMFDLGVG